MFAGGACMASNHHLKYLLLLLLHWSFQFLIAHWWYSGLTSLPFLCLFLINFFTIFCTQSNPIVVVREHSEQRYNPPWAVNKGTVLRQGLHTLLPCLRALGCTKGMVEGLKPPKERNDWGKSERVPPYRAFCKRITLIHIVCKRYKEIILNPKRTSPNTHSKICI